MVLNLGELDVRIGSYLGAFGGRITITVEFKRARLTATPSYSPSRQFYDAALPPKEGGLVTVAQWLPGGALTPIRIDPSDGRPGRL